MGTTDLDAVRDRITAIDQNLVSLIAERMDQVRRVAELKQSAPEQSLQDLAREREVFAAWVQEAESLGLSPYYVGRILPIEHTLLTLPGTASTSARSRASPGKG